MTILAAGARPHEPNHSARDWLLTMHFYVLVRLDRRATNPLRVDGVGHRGSWEWSGARRRSDRRSPVCRMVESGGIMSRVAALSLVVLGMSLAACEVRVTPPVIVEKKTVVVEEHPAPIQVHIDDKK